MTDAAEEYNEEEKEQVLNARKKAMKLLEFSDRTEKQLRDKLEEGEFPPFAVEDAIEYVKSFHYLDDRRYGESYIRVKREQKSRYELFHELTEKGLDRDTAEILLDEAELDDTGNVERLYLKKYGRRGSDDPKIFEKAVRYFAGKGYSYEAIREGIAAAIDNSEETT